MLVNRRAMEAANQVDFRDARYTGHLPGAVRWLVALLNRDRHAQVLAGPFPTREAALSRAAALRFEHPKLRIVRETLVRATDD